MAQCIGLQLKMLFRYVIPLRYSVTVSMSTKNADRQNADRQKCWQTDIGDYIIGFYIILHYQDWLVSGRMPDTGSVLQEVNKDIDRAVDGGEKMGGVCDIL